MKISCVVILLLFGCSNHNPHNINKSSILATIGDRIITVNDFIKRAEYNVRPSYCSGNSLKDKKIILNSLITEKLLALNFNNNLEDTHLFILEARKEQKMREVFFNQNIYNNISLDSVEIVNSYNNSIKEFNISYIALPDPSPLLEILKIMQDSLFTLEEISKTYLNTNKLPTRKLSFHEDINEDMYEIFFSRNIIKGKIYGPLSIGDNYYIFRVDDWNKTINLSNIKNQYDISYLKKTIKDLKSGIEYRKYINSIMHGKELDIHAENFEKLIKSIYSDIKNISLDKTEYKMRDLLNNKFSQSNLSDNDIICTISNREWSIGDFNELLNKNPVNINSRLNIHKLKRVLRKLIINKLEIYYLTEAAYNRGLDKHSLVKQEEYIWSDYIKSNQVINNLSNLSNIPKDSYDFINKVLNPLSDSLIVENLKNIKINEDYFSNISLSSIDMHVFFKEQSNKLVVPLFPMTTNKSNQEYLKEL